MAVLSGFTYNGVHSEEFGLYYLPTEEDRWFLDPEYEVYSTDIEWKHGGVYYDSKATVRTFTLNCFFENIDVAKRQAIKAWLKRGTSGKLIFDEMPFVYWIVRPGKIPVGNWYYDQDTFSGTVVITFNAYEPFGYLTRKCNTGSDSDNAADYCNLIDEEDMPAAPVAPWPEESETKGGTVSGSSYMFEIYNPGTEACGLSIEIAGITDNKIRFYNETNGTFCVFNGLPEVSKSSKSSISYDGLLYLGINGDTGLVYVKDSFGSSTEFRYHDKGVVRLEPNIGKSNVSFVNGVYDDEVYDFALDLVGYHVTDALVGAVITFHVDGDINGREGEVTAVDPENNRIYGIPRSTGVSPDSTKTVSSNVEYIFPETGIVSIKTVNRIYLQEKYSHSPKIAIPNWRSPFTLALYDIKVDYSPRLM